MRASVRRSRVLIVIIGVATVLARGALAQSAEPPEEITIQGSRTLREVRLELERSRDDLFRRFNEANQGSQTAVTCKNEQPTGSRMRQNVCRTAAENQADAAAAFEFLGSLVRSAGFNTSLATGPPGTVMAANIGTAQAQTDAVTGAATALSKFEQDWVRLLSQDQDFYRAAVQYVELEREYDSMRGVNDPSARALAVPGVAVAAAQPSAPQCEATTLTEYFQRNNVARVSGRISIAACPAGTTGSFVLVARVRDEAGEIRPIEFNETWQRDDTEDHSFNADYPIGDDTELVSVRVRNLKCTCAEAAP